MLKKTTYIIIFTSLFWTACQTKKNKEKEQNSSVDTSLNLKSELGIHDSYWILTNYFDSILKDKSISKHRLYPITWSAMALNIKKDTLHSVGLLYVKEKIKINSAKDTFGLMNSNYGRFLFFYNKQTDCIEAIDNSVDENNKYIGKHFTYRRVKEKRLYEIFDGFELHQIRNGLYQIFIDSLISGEYKSLNGGQNLILTTNGLISGFKKYNKFQIHDYFGTLHPFQNYDVICFKDTTISSTNNTKLTCYYNWKFSGNRLTLTEMLTDNYDEYYLGKKKYNFVRIKNTAYNRGLAQ
jgi:hypothetical protein